MFKGLITQLPYFLSCAAYLALGKSVPVIAGISITDTCNLDCVHCWNKTSGSGHVPFATVAQTLEKLYSLGSRYLYIQGGEPMSWNDHAFRINDVVEKAKKTGFFHVNVCTNGTYPLDAEPHSFSISLDGSPAVHDRIRCNTFDTVMENIGKSTHQNIFFNVTFNTINANDLDYLAELASSHEKIRGMILNFHIPYPGVEYLTLTPAERTALIHKAISLKRKGYAILNSIGGLKALAKNDWKRPIKLSVVTDCHDYFTCCRAYGNERICRECGYGPWAELASMLSLNVSSIVGGLMKINRGRAPHTQKISKQ